MGTSGFNCFAVLFFSGPQDQHAHLDEEEERFRSTLEKQVCQTLCIPHLSVETSFLEGVELGVGFSQADLDNLFDFDQDDIEFDEKELEQVR
jgi:hypothetical protein